MTSKFSKPVYRETDHSTVRSGGKERKIVVGLVAGDVVELRLKRERKSLFISAATVFRMALTLEGRKKT